MIYLEIQNWLDTQLGIDIWNKKYRFENETFNEWLDRVTNDNDELKQLILEKKFLFGGRILANRGLHKKGKKITYSNCYVIPAPEDSIESIYDTAKMLARTYSYGGGCGIDISKLAPKGAKVNNSAEQTTGAVSFMDLYDLTTGLIGMRGRRGALMISIDDKHPDLMEFIDIKTDLNKVTKANISIRISDDFMKAVINDEDWTLEYFRPETNERITKTLKAREIYRKIITNNWDYAEPGVLYWDRINKWTLLSEDDEFEFAGVNPCAEETLPAGGSCLLGSINLSAFVKKPFTKDAYFDYDDFKYVVEKAVIALNEVLIEGLPLHPLEIQRQSVNDWRQIGLGVMGIADMLIMLGIRYGSKEAIEFCDKIGFIMADTAIKTSALITKEQGTYPKYEKDAIMNSEFFKENTTESTKKLVEKYGLAHSQLLTIAPTGSLSTMLGISGGIEPIFNISYTRKTESLHGKEVFYKVYTPIVKKYMELNNIDKEEDLPDFFVTAMTLNWKERIDMQAIWQQHIDASISSTVNIPEHITVEEVEDLYIYAWKKGLKGATIYRDNCKRSGILLNTTTNIDNKEDKSLKRGDWEPLPEDIIYYKRKIYIGCGKLNLFIGYSPSKEKICDMYVVRSGNGGY